MTEDELRARCAQALLAAKARARLWWLPSRFLDEVARSLAPVLRDLVRAETPNPHRFVSPMSPDMCGRVSPPLRTRTSAMRPPSFCELREGHGGWHEARNGERWTVETGDPTEVARAAALAHRMSR